jgi:hypothetical protein
MVITPGALVTCKWTGTVLYVAVRADDAGRWHLRSKATDEAGRAAYTGRTAGVGDIVVVKSALTYQPGETLEFGGKLLTVLRDLGHEVEFTVLEHSRPLHRGGSVRHAGGHTTLVSKADLMIEALK